MERWLQSRSVELAAKMKYHVEFLNLILLKWVTFSKTKQQKRYNAIFLNMIKKLWSIFSENLIPVTKCINYWFIRTIYTMFMCCFCRLFTFFHVNHTKDWHNTFAIILHTNNKWIKKWTEMVEGIWLLVNSLIFRKFWEVCFAFPH